MVAPKQSLFDTPPLKYCTRCENYYDAHYFIKNTSTCKKCNRLRNKIRNDRFKKARLSNIKNQHIKAKIKKAIKLYHEIAHLLTDVSGIPHEVDHIYSIAGENSCGLNTPFNLQVVTATENKKKKNKNGLISKVLNGGDYE